MAYFVTSGGRLLSYIIKYLSFALIFVLACDYDTPRRSQSGVEEPSNFISIAYNLTKWRNFAMAQRSKIFIKYSHINIIFSMEQCFNSFQVRNDPGLLRSETEQKSSIVSMHAIYASL